MMTQQLNVCVLSAPLAAIDRRTLSQAWYSALHCANGKRSEASVRRSAMPTDALLKDEPRQSTRAERSKAAGRRRTIACRKEVTKTVESGTGAESERRARRSSLARRMEQTFLHPQRASQRATFTAAGKRVHVMVQASAGSVRLVAVCPPAIRDTVARALAQARFALASRGVPCS